MANLSKIKRDQLLNEIKNIENKYPTDTATLNTLNKLKQEITNKKYGLVWEEHSEKVDEMLVDNIPVFTEDNSRSIHSSDDEIWNFLLEGDNLHSLYLLLKTHKNKIDMIYIDPPYNTGNEDFIYNDNYIDKEDTFRHSMWLSFMKKRLELSWVLLKDQGVIFISCDENEYANLKILCDSLFGEHNYIATYLWKKTDTPPSLSNKVRRKYEYIICYGNNVNKNHMFSQGLIDNCDAPLLNSGNPYKEITFPIGSVHFNIQDGTYKHSNDKKIEIINSVNVLNGKNTNQFVAKGTWKWSQQTLENEISKGTYFIVKSNKFSIRYQRSLSNSIKIPQNNINSEVGVGTNEDGAKEIENIFGFGGVFDYAKPTSLIKFLIKMVNKSNDITILDFFAGSGTTAQAVMELNSEDKGTRKFILCTDNTKNVDAIGDYLYSKGIISIRPKKTHQTAYKSWRKEVEEYFAEYHTEFDHTDEFNLYGISQRVTYPRIKTVITGKRIDGTQYSNGISANLKYYKTDFIPKNTNQNQPQTNQSINPTSGINEVTLCDKLQEHIRELVQLETHHNIDDEYYKMIFTDADLSNLISNISTYPYLKEIYISSTILLDSNQKMLLQSKNIKISEIPDYYFSNELKENGELW